MSSSRDKGRQVPEVPGHLASIPGPTHRWHEKKRLSPVTFPPGQGTLSTEARCVTRGQGVVCLRADVEAR